MDDIIRALAEQHAELAGVLAGRSDSDWLRPSRCPGWDVADVLLHLAQTHEMAIATVHDQVEAAADDVGFIRLDGGATDTVDGAAAAAVLLQRTAGDEIAQRWYKAADELVDVLRACDPSKRVVWVTNRLSARTLAATRLSEAWIHTDDIAEAFGVVLAPTDRLQHIARLAWRTIPYAFAHARLELSGPVAFHLEGPNGDDWHFDPDEPALTTISGAAVELCRVAARRVDPSHTALSGDGPDARAVLELVRTYAL